MAPAKKRVGKIRDIVRLQVSTWALARVSRGVSRPPNKLAEIISLVNLIPADAKLPEKLLPNYGVLESAQYDETKRELLAELSALRAPDLRAYLLEYMLLASGDPIRQIFEVIDHYRDIIEWRSNLYVIARRGFYIQSHAPAIVDWEKGIVRYGRDRFSQAIEAEGVQLQNIRECVICHRLYYAGRLFYKGNKLDPYCGLKCGKKVRARRNPKAPAKLNEIKAGIEKLCKAKGWQQFERGSANVEMLCEWADATPKQCERVLDYLERNPPKKKRAKTAPKR